MEKIRRYRRYQNVTRGGNGLEPTATRDLETALPSYRKKHRSIPKKHAFL